MRSDAINILGETFGSLEVIGRDDSTGKWICRCECGNIRTVRGYDLRIGKARSCLNCLRRKTDSSKRVIKIGQRFGEWEVLEYIGNKRYICKCSCGFEGAVYSSNLLSGKSKSCIKCANTKKIKDISNKEYGRLRVLEYVGDGKWLCKCLSCGSTVEVSTGNLQSGNSTQCSECAKAGLLKDITGQKFGEWEVIKYAGDIKWECKCSCGKIAEVHGYNLRSGHSKSCGHDQLIDLTNKQINEWTVLKYAGNKKWLCKCSCGTLREVHGYELRTGQAKSCGCKKWEYTKRTMLDRYGETAPLKIDNQRELWQIEVIESNETLEELIDNLGYKPTSYELADILGMNVHRTLTYVHRYNLEHKMDLFPSISKAESEIYNIVKSFGVEAGQSNRSILHGKELDIYIPEKNLAIEFNGSYWHSTLYKNKLYHQNKTIECAKQKIRLIHIFEYEWVDEEKRLKIVSLLENILSDSGKRIYARKTNVIQISSIESKEFLNSYHLQGNAQASVKYGLYHDSELIGVMTFGKPRFNLEYKYELVRLAWKPGIHVVGGAEKLFNRFIKDYRPNNIISYCDISKFTGNVYDKLGFKATKASLNSPNYVWVNIQTNETLSRYQTQKHKLVEDGLGTTEQTEDEIMDNLGYVKIYDSGNIRYIWNKES